MESNALLLMARKTRRVIPLIPKSLKVTEETMAGCDMKEIEINGKPYPMPNGWAERMGDWGNAKKLLEE